MRVDVELNAAAPADVAALPPGLIGDGTWLRFHTTHAHAMVWVPANSDTYLLHWIESNHPGDGTALMTAIGEWADLNDLYGSLACETPVVKWYRRFGWEVRSPYLDGYAMGRSPTD